MILVGQNYRCLLKVPGLRGTYLNDSTATVTVVKGPKKTRGIYFVSFTTDTQPNITQVMFADDFTAAFELIEEN